MNIANLLHPNEQIYIFLRRDRWAVIRMVTWYGMLLVIPFVLTILLELIVPQWLAAEWRREAFVIGVVLSLSIYYLYVLIFFFRAWIDYYLDVWFVTNERIVSIEQKGLFSRTIAEQKLFRIQDVHAEVHGIIPTLLDFGNVTIQTAGTEVVFQFKEVPAPHDVARRVVKLVEWNKRKHGMTS